MWKLPFGKAARERREMRRAKEIAVALRMAPASIDPRFESKDTGKVQAAAGPGAKERAAHRTVNHIIRDEFRSEMTRDKSRLSKFNRGPACDDPSNISSPLSPLNPISPLNVMDLIVANSTPDSSSSSSSYSSSDSGSSFSSDSGSSGGSCD